jgi:hypothetical protein
MKTSQTLTTFQTGPYRVFPEDAGISFWAGLTTDKALSECWSLGFLVLEVFYCMLGSKPKRAARQKLGQN